MDSHPCVSCGACCNYYKVQFHRFECQSDSFSVPEDLTYPVLDSENLVMKGTYKKDPRCIALKGEIGVSVGCSIYEQRPSCCRNFNASYENGQQNFRCDQARIAKGMKPLTIADWLEVDSGVDGDSAAIWQQI